MTALRPTSSASQRAFSADPAEPTTQQPLILAIWAAIDPTAPAAVETNTLAAGFNWAIVSKPPSAVNPVPPSAWSGTVRGSPSTISSLLNPSGPEAKYSLN